MKKAKWLVVVILVLCLCLSAAKVAALANALTLPQEGAAALVTVPQTGDNTVIWILCALISGAGLLILTVSGKRREEK